MHKSGRGGIEETEGKAGRDGDLDGEGFDGKRWGGGQTRSIDRSVQADSLLDDDVENLRLGEGGVGVDLWLVSLRREEELEERKGRCSSARD